MRVRTAHFALWSPRSAQRTSVFGGLIACTPPPGVTLDRMTFGDVDCGRNTDDRSAVSERRDLPAHTVTILSEINPTPPPHADDPSLFSHL